MNVTVDNLNDVMEFDHVIQVHDDGTVTVPDGIYAPELHLFLDENGQVDADADADLQDQAAPFSLETGWTGQHGYSGPMMHQSEFIGGGMASYILETPGYWVTVYPSYSSADENAYHEPDSWCVAYCSVEDHAEYVAKRAAQFARIMEGVKND